MVELAHATRIELLARSKPWPVGRLRPYPWGRVWRHRVTRGTKSYEVVILSHGTKNRLLLLLTPPTYREVESFHAVVRDESGRTPVVRMREVKTGRLLLKAASCSTSNF